MEVWHPDDQKKEVGADHDAEFEVVMEHKNGDVPWTIG